MKQALIYSLKVWITALLLAPTLAYPIWWLVEWIISYVNRGKVFSMGIIYGFDINASTISWGILWSALYFLPYLAILFVSVIFLRRGSTSIRSKKTALTGLAIILTLCPFPFVKVLEYEVIFDIRLAWLISFGLIFIAGVWFYRLKPVNKAPNIEPTI